MASSSIVIKVKFGETLRRFNASINDKKLVLDIVMLREKIRGLFSFGSDVEFTMTYVDEDGDVVTLADDDDLHDVVRQSLNPVRITVNLNSSNSNVSSGYSTPQRSPNQLPFQTLNSGVSELLKSVPEPYREALAKLPLDLASKASSSVPTVAELLEKMKVVYLSQMAASQKVQSPTAGPSNVKSEPSKVQVNVNPPTAGPLKVKSEPLTVESRVQVNPEAGSSNLKKKEKQVVKVTEDVKPPTGVDLNVPYIESEPFQAPVNQTKSVGEGSTGKIKNNTTDGVEVKKEFGSEKKNEDTSSRWNPEPLKSVWSPDLVEQVRKMNQHLQDGMRAQGSNDSVSQGHFRHSRSPHWKRHGLVHNAIGTIFHMGVRCDGCGVHPITGPRYKSKVKDDYDLCNVCFAGMGNATDYTIIDRPATNFRRQHTPYRGFYDPSFNVPFGATGTLPHAMRAPGSKLHRSKLDSRFILDVNVLDGTIMAPFTAFTKIWRMRNIGSTVWPHGSQLHWIGGDRLSNLDFVDVEIPADGLPVDKELDIAVDFTAPELPGRYVSYWRMTSPSGQKFGQRVWVLIQVDASMKDLGETSINLNLPPVMTNPEVVNQEMNFPINDSLIINNSGGVSTPSAPPATATTSVYNSTQVASALGSLPAGPTVSSGSGSGSGLDFIVDFTVPRPAVFNGPPSSPPTVAAGSGGREVSEEQEAALVKELEEMGFKQPDLNTEVLRMNNYDLEKSIDDLCGVMEWDPMLDELQEMIWKPTGGC